MLEEFVRGWRAEGPRQASPGQSESASTALGFNHHNREPCRGETKIVTPLWGWGAFFN